ncbi:MAG: hypothetical protein NC205_09460 [Prevotella sp.]|nr:hypothetical protein [Alistipes senegalensis]MCM1358811.1 hypothetical protein [Prevotella sp.]
MMDNNTKRRLAEILSPVLGPFMESLSESQSNNNLITEIEEVSVEETLSESQLNNNLVTEEVIIEETLQKLEEIVKKQSEQMKQQNELIKQLQAYCADLTDRCNELTGKLQNLQVKDKETIGVG